MSVTETIERRIDRRGHVNDNPKDIGFWALVAEDFRSNDSDLFSQGFWALFWHRFGNKRMDVGHWLLRLPLTVVYKVMFKVTEWVCGIHLPYNVQVGRRLRIDHFGGIVLMAQSIGDDCLIRQNTTLGIAHPDDPYARPIIADRVQIGAGAVIVGAVHIGPDATVGANAVVVRDVPGGAVVGGVPARVLR